MRQNVFTLLQHISGILELTHLQGQSVALCDTLSPPGPPLGHHLGILQVPASELRLRSLTVTSGIPRGPRAPLHHMTEAAGKRGNGGHST